jgi:hypothetical protein
MKHRHAIADLEQPRVHPRANGSDHPAGLVTADDRCAFIDTARREVLETQRPDHLRRVVPIKMQIAAAHARSLHLDHGFARPWGRVGKLHQLQLAIPFEYNASHVYS